MVSRGSIACTFVSAWLAATSLQAQDASPAAPKLTPEQQAEMEIYARAGAPGEQHRGLAAAAGKYDVRIRNWYEPGAPPAEERGAATRVMALDGRVLMEEFEGTMMGGPFNGHGMTGYDNVTGQYWSTWNDSMSTGLMVSTGTCNGDRVCTFEGTWNDPIRKGPTRMRMTTRWTGPDTEVFEMYGPDKQDREVRMMEMTYTRRK